MLLNFEKWHGCKNDFIVVWLNPSERSLINSIQARAKELCNKDGSSIGADGILVLVRDKPGSLLSKELWVINSDGSLASNCGNGLRCAALSTVKQHLEAGQDFSMESCLEFKIQDQIFACRFIGHGFPENFSGNWPLVVVEMPPPRFDDIKTKSISELIKNKDVSYCQISNPHLTILKQDLSNTALLQDYAQKLQVEISGGINVHFVESIEIEANTLKSIKNSLGTAPEDTYGAWVFERGVGPTPACGSGACAIGATLFKNGESPYGSWIAIRMPGGYLYVRQESSDTNISLVGPGHFSFSGQIIF